MAFIDKNLLPDEKIVFRTKKSLIIFAGPIFWVLIALVGGFYLQKVPMAAPMSGALWLVALVLWLYTFIEYWFSDFAVTNKRVMMREGFFTRHSNELRVSTVSQVNVDQSLIGQIFNYGNVSLNAFGAFDRYSNVASPYAFQRAVNQLANP